MAEISADATAGIEVTGVSRAFGSVHAVREATFTVKPGSVTALIGPNGSGKTTLILMLASLLQPDNGSITIGGHDPVADAESVRQVMGWMPDALGSWASLTVRAALETTGRMYRLNKSDARVRAGELIESVGLADLASQPARVLSRGQKQRLSLARALVHKPRILLLDEPASGLDPAARADLRALVRSLASDGVAVLISSHVLAELEEMADAAVFMTAGVTASAESVAKASRSTRQWRIRAIDPAGNNTALHNSLLAIGVDTKRFTIDNLGALVNVADEADAAAVLRALVQAGVEISSYSPAVGDLEHTFLDLNRNGGSPS